MRGAAITTWEQVLGRFRLRLSPGLSISVVLSSWALNGSSCCLNLGAAVFDAVKGIVHLHFVVGLRSKRGEQVLLSSRDYGTGNAICAPIL